MYMYMYFVDTFCSLRELLLYLGCNVQKIMSTSDACVSQTALFLLYINLVVEIG